MSFSLINLWNSLKMAFMYIPITLKLSVISFVISLTIGFLTATLRVYRVRVISKVLNAFITIYLGLPVVVALLIYQLIYLTNYQSLPAFMQTDIIIVGYFVLILSVSCTVSETFVGAFKSIDKVQFEAGYSIGLTQSQTLCRIVLPQMIPVAIPGLVNRLVDTIKATCLVSAIGIVEIMSGAMIPCAQTYSYLEGYIAAAIAYWILVIIVEQSGKLIENYTGKHRRRVS